MNPAQEEPPVSKDSDVLRAGWGYASVSDKIANIVLERPVRWPWMTAFLVTFAGTLMLLGAIMWLFVKGVDI